MESYHRLRRRLLVATTVAAALAVPGVKHVTRISSGVAVVADTFWAAKQGRDRRTQAVLPLKGKILNVEKARFDKMLASAEVGTLITALGCGIGRNDFDVAKLRYHRIILMADADVDGAHIRTLLLTFFYRQMPELIERGHIFIAQPPLYKVKRGKSETYVKDDAELNALLLRNALDEAALHTTDDQGVAQSVSGARLESLARQYIDVQGIFARWARRYDPRVLEAMLYVPVIRPEHQQDVEFLRQWAGILQTYIDADAHEPKRYRIELQVNAGGQPVRFDVFRTQHGLTTEKHIQREFFDSQEYKRIAELNLAMQGLLRPGAYVAKGDDRKEVTAFKDAIGWLMDQARRGQTIQRYKGLGEMNPDQLWDTTINPATRRLIQVRIEDAVTADDLFTTLMGDQVEPRREFIEKNALAVANLDI